MSKTENKDNELPRFPVQVFRTPITRKFIKEAAEAVSCAVGFVAGAMLSLYSIIIGNTRRIELSPSWTEKGNLWIAIISVPGGGKTPAIEITFHPLFMIQKELMENCKPSGEDDEEEENEKRWLLVTTDFTSEALDEVFVVNEHGVLAYADELAGLIKAQGQYKGGKGSDKEKQLSLWKGTPTIINRKGKKTIMVSNPWYGIIGGVQPDVLPGLFNMVSNGYVDRFLFINDTEPEFDWKPEGVAKKIINDFNDHIVQLFDTLQGTSYTLPLSTEAKELWANWITQHTQEYQKPLFPSQLRGVWSKLRAYCGRFALILEMANSEGKSKQISKETLEDAIKLVDYFKAQVNQAFITINSQNKDERLELVIAWVQDRIKTGKVRKKGSSLVVYASDLYNNAVGGIRKAEEGKDMLEQLAEKKMGWLHTEKAGNGRNKMWLSLNKKAFGV